MLLVNVDARWGGVGTLARKVKEVKEKAVRGWYDQAGYPRFSGKECGRYWNGGR